MSTQDGGDRDEELLRRYRQASDAQPVAPSARVRAAILAEGRQAAARNAQAAPAGGDAPQRKGRSQWRYALLGTASAAALAALLVLPRFLQQPARVIETAPEPQAPMRAQAPVQVSQPSADKTEAAGAARADRPGERERDERALYAKKFVPNPQPASAAPSEQRKLEKDDALLAREAAPARSTSMTPAEAGAPAAAPSVTGTLSNAAPAPAAGAAASAMDAASHPKAAAAQRRAAAEPLLDAARDGDVPRIHQLIDGGAALESRDESGRTPLMLATMLGRRDAVAALLARGADPNAADRSGSTPLQRARLQHSIEIAVLLEKAGAH